MPVTTEELAALAVLLASMSRELGIAFSHERVFWSEDALAIFVVGREWQASAQPA